MTSAVESSARGRRTALASSTTGFKIDRTSARAGRRAVFSLARFSGNMSANNAGGKVNVSHSLNNKNVSLPMSRVKLIMKSSPDVSSINQDALFVTTKATELFVQYLTQCSFKNGSGKEKNTLAYSDLANAAEQSEIFQFLTDILPKKILAKDYLRSLEERAEDEDSD
ncbi:chromatin accessibility complex protein 1 [Paramormyrops kingsleyae]|uniref:Chromatin accessibility complex protein 1 n=1 Tax=Paramormyrops kingsleyae TaxID=1676925 RepID=A0A3B3RBK1_9TELE|nr:chromatin accessibility complex protein 1 [Paramormyrops kingsleyae]